MTRSYAIYDVFTDTPLKGNPLAVVFDGEGLDTERMQAIAAEFALSETVFVLAPEVGTHAAKLRIFTPARELPFAGHPTVGTAIALAERKFGRETSIDLVKVLEEQVGPIRCAVRLRSDGASFAEFDLPRQSAKLSASIDRQALADALGLRLTQIGFENHVAGLWSAGVPFVTIPVHDLAAAAAVDFDPGRWEKIAPLVEGRLAAAYIYCRGGQHHNARFHVRMFAPDMGISEDPATGAALAAFSGTIQHFDQFIDGNHAILIEQGVEMGRTSFLHLHLQVEGGAVAAARIGGEAVKLAEGTLFI
ncbi:phenazine biosynthesis protein PhzF [Xaviernesmea oryzae]|uniref:Phenazine biosynthesis protein PhzF n=1 Tax=Xaviernesmea oryzae TaxID=464029 RepID=A0A1Q9AT85_9HYPH|nr:PhzF family phenazine biosynthesis protein [Xaviernesmea oryzae]OLP58647.1 phenazine biosynthesis protein PhzF [Xaviernesmea oryzae]SEK65577.1 trans-2,3-dihydro-3-hydroxyanthranilate isomerase [Xaviernesmea oryzae]